MLRRRVLGLVLSGLLVSQAAMADTGSYFRMGKGTASGAAATPGASANGPSATPAASALRITSPHDASTRASGVGATDSFTAAVSGSSGAVTWSSQDPTGASDPWPSWASVSTDGVVTLKPTTASLTTLRLFAKDAATGTTNAVSFAVKAASTFTIQQNDQLFRAAGTVQQTDAPTVAKAVGTVTWQVANKPDWISSFDTTTGVLRGTVPNQAMPDAQVTLTATDAGTGQRASTTFRLSVGTPLTVTYPTMVISTDPGAYSSGLLFGTAGRAMSHTPTVVGAKGAMSWKAGDGDFGMPAGLTLDPSTGVISGTPTKATYVSGYKSPALNYYYFHIFGTDSDGSVVHFGVSNQIGSAVRSATLNGAPFSMDALNDGSTATKATIPTGAVLQVETVTAVDFVSIVYDRYMTVCYSWSADGVSWSVSSCSSQSGRGRLTNGSDIGTASSAGQAGPGAYRYHRIYSNDAPLYLVETSFVQY